jgi:hypothetical protein
MQIQALRPQPNQVFLASQPPRDQHAIQQRRQPESGEEHPIPLGLPQMASRRGCGVFFSCGSQLIGGDRGEQRTAQPFKNQETALGTGRQTYGLLLAHERLPTGRSRFSGRGGFCGWGLLQYLIAACAVFPLSALRTSKPNRVSVRVWTTEKTDAADRTYSAPFTRALPGI